MGTTYKPLSERACVLASDTTWMEDAAIAQLLTTSQLEGMQRVAGMPDLHPGRGYPVGAAFFSTHRLYPALVGNDIGCGMALWQTDLRCTRLKLDALDQRIGNIDGPMADSEAAAALLAEAGVPSGPHDRALGTLGGGNHFAEFQKIDTVYQPETLSASGMDARCAVLLVHTGSRGLGEQILRSHIDAHGHRGLPSDTPATATYLAAHDSALRFATANRHGVAQRLLNPLRAERRLVLELHHNFVEAATIHGQQGWLHRKGATPSTQGLVLIPGSRGDFSHLVRPLHACHDTLLSLAHGAGRKWMRSACKGRLAGRFTPAQLSRTPFGSRVVCNDRSLIYEEAPQAYKCIDDVVQPLVDAGLVERVARLTPVFTYKTRGACCE